MNQHMTWRKLTLSILLLGALPLAQAQTPGGAPPAQDQIPAPLFEQLDVNRDGYVTPEEAKRSAEVTARFKELDANRDGRISIDEFKKGMQDKM